MEELITAHGKMEFLAWSSCTLGLMIIMLCLFPGITEIAGGIARVFRKSSRKRRHHAGHRVQEDQTRRDPDGDQIEDTQGTEATA